MNYRDPRSGKKGSGSAEAEDADGRERRGSRLPRADRKRGRAGRVFLTLLLMSADLGLLPPAGGGSGDACIYQYLDNCGNSRLAALEQTMLWLGDELQLTQLYLQLQCHYKYAPLCVTSLQVNATNDTRFAGDWPKVRAALQGVLLAKNASSDVQQLSMFLKEMHNISAHFEEECAKEALDLTRWLESLVSFQWFTALLGPVAFLILLCLFLPCLLRCICSMLRRAILDAKADLHALIQTPRDHPAIETSPL
ncbi:endogenous retrovirus group K member 18 Env polyprotein-like [Vombatus ursinus]|uniref:endogenous retrovirus group K member 18 Env polyprotein-like n=1 Tax=Vombatus ursinus TaxID=29139 RepID=UPI000FFD2F21|nr:endogenous retrovirus group K member 18 Env polyprotein-like [Vombatus ursinus]